MQKYEDFPLDYQQTLQAIQDNFKQNIITCIKNDTDRIFYRHETKMFNNVGIAINKLTTILMENVRLLSTPEFKLENVNLDFKQMYLDVDFTMNDLSLECDYHLNTTNTSQQGKIKFMLKQMSVGGRVSLVFCEDSFMPTTYDMNYVVGEVATEAFNFTPSEGDTEQTGINLSDYLGPYAGTTIDTSLMSLIWNDLETYLDDDFIHRFVDGTVVEFSVDEMFLNEPEMIKAYVASRSKYCNKIIDEFLQSLQNHLADAKELLEVEQFALNTTVGVKDCKVDGSQSKLSDFNSVHRHTDASCYEDGDDMVYYAVGDFSEFKCCMENKISIAEQSYNAHITLEPYHHRILIKLKVSKDDEKTLTLKFYGFDGVDLMCEDEDTQHFERIKDKLAPYLFGYFHTNAVLTLQKIAAAYN